MSLQRVTPPCADVQVQSSGILVRSRDMNTEDLEPHRNTRRQQLPFESNKRLKERYTDTKSGSYRSHCVRERWRRGRRTRRWTPCWRKAASGGTAPRWLGSFQYTLCTRLERPSPALRTRRWTTLPSLGPPPSLTPPFSSSIDLDLEVQRADRNSTIHRQQFLSGSDCFAAAPPTMANFAHQKLRRSLVFWATAVHTTAVMVDKSNSKQRIEIFIRRHVEDRAADLWMSLGNAVCWIDIGSGLPRRCRLF